MRPTRNLFRLAAVVSLAISMGLLTLACAGNVDAPSQGKAPEGPGGMKVGEIQPVGPEKMAAVLADEDTHHLPADPMQDHHGSPAEAPNGLDYSLLTDEGDGVNGMLYSCDRTNFNDTKAQAVGKNSNPIRFYNVTDKDGAGGNCWRIYTGRSLEWHAEASRNGGQLGGKSAH